ncbi:MAG: ybbE [Myxococcaceae bacterium]|nr:ybbE [Myxococcaceae bacterium]
MGKLDALIEEGERAGVFPLARGCVFVRGHQVWEGGNTPAETVFDLASLTKVMATTALALELQVDLQARLARWLPTARAGDATLADLLFHRSGLPAFLPFFAQAMAEIPQLFDDDCPPKLRAAARERVLEQVLATAPTRPAGEASVYSDLGFILLGEALATAGGAPLDALFADRIAGPLGLSARYRRCSTALPLPASLAPTGNSRPREPAPGQEGLWSVPARPTRPGEVDDDNAWCLDGVSGHAGLFGTALDVARFGQAVLAEKLAPPTPWAKDATTPGSTRALGFDTPSDLGASCGPRFGRSGPCGAIGHLGFTGTSLWIDLDRQLVVALCTNRVALGRANLAIRDFRPRFHDAVLDALAP